MRRDSGITLIELVVAMALFALVAAMSLQAITGMLRARDHLLVLSGDTARLSLALTLLRQDLSAAVPILFYTPGGRPASALDITPPGPRLSLSVAGQAGAATPDFTGFHRVEWQFDPANARLMRRVWPALQPAARSQVAPAVEMLTGVRGFELRLYRGEAGWQSWRDLPPGQIDGRLPDAIEVTLATDRFGALTLIETFR